MSLPGCVDEVWGALGFWLRDGVVLTELQRLLEVGAEPQVSGVLVLNLGLGRFRKG